MQEEYSDTDTDMDDVLAEIMVEFGRHLRSDLEEDAVPRARRVFDRTVRRSIREGTHEWEEPLRSFVLRHVGRIARRCDGQAEGGRISGDLVEEVAERLFSQVQEALERRGIEVLATVCLETPGP